MPWASMLIALAAIGAASAPPEPPVTVCNGMKVDLAEVSLDDALAKRAQSGPLHPGDCAAFPGLPPGAYTLRFVERSGRSASLCAREVSLSPSASIRVTADDGARCMQ